METKTLLKNFKIIRKYLIYYNYIDGINMKKTDNFTCLVSIIDQEGS